jgi:hypothetical protein
MAVDGCPGVRTPMGSKKIGDSPENVLIMRSPREQRINPLVLVLYVYPHVWLERGTD